jgi:competence protein ComEA
VVLLVVAALPATAGPPAAKGALVDINSASQKDLESLPGVGAATAKKIIAGRPFSSVADLARVGVPAKTIEKITPLVTVGAAAPAAVPPATAKPPKATGGAAPAAVAAPSAALVDINSASQKDLESVPGVGAATAKKIIAGRPFTSVGDLAKAGVPAKTIEKVTPLVTVGAGVPAAPAAASATTATPPKAAGGVAAAVPATGSAALLDLNTASEKDLEGLPGIGPAYAAKIVQGRPFASVADLTKTGIPAKTVEKITPLVKVVPPAAVAQVPPVAGMVWVNLSSKVYHYSGDEWYGKTKNGKFMTEQDAIAAGYHASKEKIKNTP